MKAITFLKNNSDKITLAIVKLTYWVLIGLLICTTFKANFAETAEKAISYGLTSLFIAILANQYGIKISLITNNLLIKKLITDFNLVKKDEQ